MDAQSPDQGHRSAYRRRGMGNRRSSPVRRRLRAPSRATTDRVVVGLHPHPRAGPLSHQSHAGVGNLPAGRHPRRALRVLPPPRAARCHDHRVGGRRRHGGNLDSGPAQPTPDPGSACVGEVGRSPRCTGGGVHWPAGRGCGIASAPTPRGGPMGAPEPFLADPAVWHKIDLVRVRDRKAPGGWRYYAHLLSHQPGYQSPATCARRAEIPTGRRAGADANVSNLALASFPGGHPDQLVIGQITCTDEHQKLPRAKAPGRGRVSGHWIARGATPMPTSTAPPCGNRSGRNAPPPKACRPNTSPTRAGRGRPAAMVCLCARTATTASRAATTAPGWTRPLKRGRPVRPSTPAPTRSRRGSWPPTATRSPSRTARSRPGRGCGASGSPCSAQACSWLRSRVSAPPLAARYSGRAPARPRSASTASAGPGCPNPSPSAPTTAPACGLRADRDVTSAVLAACVVSPTRTIPPPRVSTTRLPTPCGRR